MKNFASQVRAARGLLNLTQQDLADLSRVSLRTIVQLERGDREPSPSIAQALKLSLEAAGIEFIPENGGGAGVRWRK
ncbi:MAG: helix-turn-helix domain-containing protein [Mesorhizobium sp.]|uniref:helix-turn-helix transcriptional regulator n=1 Tax=Mesorhizobium sp. TaxID=1871066 RepID=UPI000FE33E31|nr:helix-turn-helix domain-containing protein [Mesorhizobium sp.]RWG81492.1 MAG: helix-turn-helix domain-containing protein [Mesorhizobium sp.]RWK17404.1 MAG: helix-turn-helix domain-containing protein [Mesorhizobium sp.]RWK25722.1 MAG: helix-turn-helix domain-containing protein [Mesorhizobium sp.]TIQ39046.1 MAG: helix-turn-helix domain-containing protein [Mesorhizobium sp.]